MLKKVLYNKIKILGIPESLNLDSEEFVKFLIEKHRAIFFKYETKNKKPVYRLCDYSGFNPDYLGKATKFQPIAVSGGETYKIFTEENSVIYRENPLKEIADDSFISEDINKYIEQLRIIDECIIINSKQVLIPFIAKGSSAKQCEKLKKLLVDIFGEEYKNLIVELSLKDTNNGTIIETTNPQLFIQQLQDTKKKIIDEAFVYLGVASPMGKLAHQSELEVEQTSAIPDFLEKILLDSIGKFILKINDKFGLNMKCISNINNSAVKEIEKGE